MSLVGRADAWTFNNTYTRKTKVVERKTKLHVKHTRKAHDKKHLRYTTRKTTRTKHVKREARKTWIKDISTIKSQ